MTLLPRQIQTRLACVMHMVTARNKRTMPAWTGLARSKGSPPCMSAVIDAAGCADHSGLEAW